MKRFLIASIFALVLAVGIGYSAPASAKSPVFGNAKVALMSTDAAKQVTAKGGTTAYYIYYGMYYMSNALYYAGLGQYYNYYGYNGSSGTTTNYLYYAQSNAYYSYYYMYYAYYYSYYGY